MVRRFYSLMLALALSILCSAPSEAQGKKGGGGGSTPPPTLNTRFSVQLISGTDVRVRDINNYGIVAGFTGNTDHSAYIYYSTSGAFFDLGAGVSTQPVRDQLSGQLGANWVFELAEGINDFGQVTGSVANLTNGKQQGYLLNTFNSPDTTQWQLVLLPEITGFRSRLDSIALTGNALGTLGNFDGTLAGFFLWDSAVPSQVGIIDKSLVFQQNISMNSSGVVAGISGGLSLFVDVNPTAGLPNRQTHADVSDCRGLGGINEWGDIAVSGRVKTGTKQNSWSASSLLLVSQQSSQVVSALSYSSTDVNAAADIVAKLGYDASLAYNGSATDTKIIVRLQDIIAAEDPYKSLFQGTVDAAYGNLELNDRDGSNFGQVTGEIILSTGRIGFVLTPVLNN